MSKPLTSLAAHFHDHLDREIDGIPAGGDRSKELLWTVANLQGVAIGLAQVLDHVADGLTSPAEITQRATSKLDELEELNRMLTESSPRSGSVQAAQFANANGRTSAYAAVRDRFTDHTPTAAAEHPGARHHITCKSVDEMVKVCTALKAENLPFSVSIDLERPA